RGNAADVTGDPNLRACDHATLAMSTERCGDDYLVPSTRLSCDLQLGSQRGRRSRHSDVRAPDHRTINDNASCRGRLREDIQSCRECRDDSDAGNSEGSGHRGRIALGWVATMMGKPRAERTLTPKS